MGHNLKAEWCFALTSKSDKNYALTWLQDVGNTPRMIRKKTRLGIQKKWFNINLYALISLLYILFIYIYTYSLHHNITLMLLVAPLRSTNFPIPECSLPIWAPLKHLESSRLRAARARHSGHNVRRVRRRRRVLELFVVPPPGGSRPYRSSIHTHTPVLAGMKWDACTWRLYVCGMW